MEIFFGGITIFYGMAYLVKQMERLGEELKRKK
jgi:hypothetical protein